MKNDVGKFADNFSLNCKDQEGMGVFCVCHKHQVGKQSSFAHRGLALGQGVHYEKRSKMKLD